MSSSEDEDDGSLSGELDALMTSFTDEEVGDLSALLEESNGEEEADDQFQWLGNATQLCMLHRLVDLMGSDLEDEEEEKVWGGSHPGKVPNKQQDFWGAHDCLITNYFSGPQSKYDKKDFEIQFCMLRDIFEHI